MVSIESSLYLVPGEGPYSLIVCPSRELARQLYDFCRFLCEALEEANYPRLNISLCIGGESVSTQAKNFRYQSIPLIKGNTDIFSKYHEYLKGQRMHALSNLCILSKAQITSDVT